MIVSLIKTASELEIFAREFEVSCSNLDQLLRPTFELYKLAPPPLPTPLPLTAYPLDFQAPEGKDDCLEYVRCIKDVDVPKVLTRNFLVDGRCTTKQMFHLRGDPRLQKQSKKYPNSQPNVP